MISVIRNLPRTVELQAVSGLLSRTIFCQQVRKRTDEWKRGGPTFSVVLIKANQYEQGGKYYSQEARVVAAQAITRFLTATVREMDIVGHYGSGCFALLLPMAGLADAIRIAERLREGFSEYTSLAQGEKLRCMMSVGVVQVTEKDDSILLLERAEAAMAVADHQGNNRTCCHDGERCTPIAAMLETTDYLA